MSVRSTTILNRLRRARDEGRPLSYRPEEVLVLHRYVATLHARLGPAAVFELQAEIDGEGAS